MVNLQTVFLDPFGQFLGTHALVPLCCGGIHQQAVAGGGAERVDDIDSALRIALPKNRGGIPGGIDGAGDAGGQAHVDDILSVLQERRKEIDILGDIHLGRAGIGAF